jgi:NADPH2:quinone reductase
MRAAVVTRFGAPGVFEISEIPGPIPGPGEVSIDVTYAAVGLVDIFIRQGLYKDREGLPRPPYVPGLVVAGSIRELGAGVDGFTVGEPVVSDGDRSGRWLRVDQRRRRPLRRQPCLLRR